MSSFHRGTARLAAVGLAIGLVAACGDSTAPELADPAALTAELAAANEPLETPVFQSFEGLDNLSTPIAAAAPAGALLLATRPSRLAATGDPTVRSVATAERLRALVPRLSILATQDTIIPDTLVGTWVWDEVNDTYVKSGTRPAPANTVRIILYVTDEFTEMPVEPVDEIGYLDIVDNQPVGAGYSVGVTVKDSAGTTTYVDYDVTVTPGTGSFTASAAGFVSNGLQGALERTLDFTSNFSASGTETSGSVSADATFDLNNPSISLELHDDATFSGTTATFTRDFRFHRPGEVITLAGTVTVDQPALDTFEITLDITVKVNGGTYARIQGTITIEGDIVTQDVTISGPGRNQGEVLAALTFAADGLFGAIDHLFDPIESLTP
ncbi:MAG TPA: hypothetical protein VF978_06805 [Gemmatimonadales bacterium]